MHHGKSYENSNNNFSEGNSSSTKEIKKAIERIHQSKEDGEVQKEDFSEFINMKLIETEEELQAFETKLKDADFNAKLRRYFHSVYALNGKRNGAAFFKTIIRRLATPSVFMPYSWKGIKRANLSFKLTFPNFVNFMENLLRTADFDFSTEDNEKAFTTYLGMKNIELKRFVEGSLNQRATSYRKRKKSDPSKREKQCSVQFEIEYEEQQEHKNDNRNDAEGDEEAEDLSDNEFIYIQ